MGQTVLSRDTNLSKTFQGVRKKLFTEPYRGYLREQYCSNLIVYQSEFTENVCKYKENQTIFDQDWLNWSKLTIRVNPYCSWLLIVRDIVKLKKVLSKDNMVQVVLQLDLNLLEIFFKQNVHQTICAFVKNLSNLF